MLLRMDATDNSGAACPVEMSSSEISVTTGSTPLTPTILGTGVVCDGKADLTLVPQETTGTFTYHWYKNGVLLANTDSTLSVTDPGVVITGTVTNATGCTSGIATKTIATEVSSLPVLSWLTPGTDALYNDVKTYQAATEFGPATFVWTVDAGSVKGAGASATVTFPPSGTKVTLKGKATNACGSAEITKEIAISVGCPTPLVAAASQTTFNGVEGIVIQAKISATNVNQETYEWYKNTTASTTGGQAISGSSATVGYTITLGTTYLYCIVTNGCGTKATSPLFTVTGIANPSSLEIGAGTLTGKSCFDINKSNDGGGCAPNSSRVEQATNFATQFVQPYVFTASTSGSKSNLRFVIVDPNGLIESSNADTAGVPGTINNGQAVTLTVNYKKTLSDVGGIIYGRVTADALKAQIYAVYNNGTKAVSYTHLTLPTIYSV